MLILWGVAFVSVGLILAALVGVSSQDDFTKNPVWIIAEGKKSLTQRLKDPDSVEFRNVWAGTLKSANSSRLIACGYFNAKNGFGGQTGGQRFIAGADGMVMTDEKDGGMLQYTWEETCITGRVR